jgi:hypothetical protein
MSVYDIIDNLNSFEDNFENIWNDLNDFFKNGDGIEQFVVIQIKHDLAKKYIHSENISSEIKEELKDYL